MSLFSRTFIADVFLLIMRVVLKAVMLQRLWHVFHWSLVLDQGEICGWFVNSVQLSCCQQCLSSFQVN